MLLFSVEVVERSLGTRLHLFYSSIQFLCCWHGQGFVLTPDSNPTLVLGIVFLEDQRLISPLPMGKHLILETNVEMTPSSS